MGILKELNDLAKVITGTNPNKKEIAKALDYIEQNYTSGGSSSTGSDIFVITGTDNGGTYTIDKTFQELVGAYTEGKPMVYIDTTGSTFLNVNMAQGKIIGFTGSIINIDVFTSTMKVKVMGIGDGMIFTDSKNYTLTLASSTPTPGSDLNLG